MEEKRLKVELELHVVGDGRTYLNFWNWKNGEDIIAELKNGKLFQGDEKEVEVSLDEFINQVKSKF